MVGRILNIMALLLIIALAYPVGYFVLTDSSGNTPPRAPEFSSNKKGLGAYVINLDESKERYVHIKKSIDGLGIPVTRISGVKGNGLSQAEIAEKVDLTAYKKYMGHLPKMGMVGCCLSHFKAWQTFLESDDEFAVIFEDDVSFDPAQLQQAINQLTQTPNLWDITMFEISHGGTPLTVKTFENGQKLVVYLTEITHGGAYLINRHAATELLSKSLPIKLAIDHYFTRPWEFNLKLVGFENPRLVHQTFGSSDIAASNPIPQEPRTMAESATRALFKLQSYVMRGWYALKMYISLT